jgi:hypothetical protein
VLASHDGGIFAFKENVMNIDGNKIEVSSEEARGAVTEHGVRYVLFFGLLLAIILLSAIWILGSIYKYLLASKPRRAPFGHGADAFFKILCCKVFHLVRAFNRVNGLNRIGEARAQGRSRCLHGAR